MGRSPRHREHRNRRRCRICLTEEQLRARLDSSATERLADRIRLYTLLPGEKEERVYQDVSEHIDSTATGGVSVTLVVDCTPHGNDPTLITAVEQLADRVAQEIASPTP